MTALRVTTRKVNVYACKCERCGHEWEAVGKEPERCASCKRKFWNAKPGELKRGRPARRNGELGGRKPGKRTAKAKEGK